MFRNAPIIVSMKMKIALKGLVLSVYCSSGLVLGLMLVLNNELY